MSSSCKDTYIFTHAEIVQEIYNRKYPLTTEFDSDIEAKSLKKYLVVHFTNGLIKIDWDELVQVGTKLKIHNLLIEKFFSKIGGTLYVDPNLKGLFSLLELYL